MAKSELKLKIASLEAEAALPEWQAILEKVKEVYG